MQKDIEEGNLKVVHIYGTYGNDHEVMDYIKGGVRNSSNIIGGRLRRRRELAGLIQMLKVEKKSTSQGAKVSMGSLTPVHYKRELVIGWTMMFIPSNYCA